jgi:predicted lipoprotein with Yx(FWY)xxD motif
MKTILASTLALGLFAGVALAAPVKTMQTSLGDVLAGENGMTLYTFKKDAAGVSNCNDDCAKNWPPLAATAEDKADGAYSIITRADGSLQWAKDGMALYFWVKDAKPGDTTGHGVKEVWEVAKP